jgi:hypothetical protein
VDELISILTDIRDQLAELNNKIDALTGYGAYSISDIFGKLDDINSSLGTIDMTIMTKD